MFIVQKKYDTFSDNRKLSIMNNIANAAKALTDYDISSSGTGPSSWSMLPINCFLVIRAATISQKRISPFPGPQFPMMLGRGSTERSNREKLGLKSKRDSCKFYRISFGLCVIYLFLFHVFIRIWEQR